MTISRFFSTLLLKFNSFPTRTTSDRLPLSFHTTLCVYRTQYSCWLRSQTFGLLVNVCSQCAASLQRGDSRPHWLTHSSGTLPRLFRIFFNFLSIQRDFEDLYLSGSATILAIRFRVQSLLFDYCWESPFSRGNFMPSTSNVPISLTISSRRSSLPIFSRK